jgi:hypothetical protein
LSKRTLPMLSQVSQNAFFSIKPIKIFSFYLKMKRQEGAETI